MSHRRLVNLSCLVMIVNLFSLSEAPGAPNRRGMLGVEVKMADNCLTVVGTMRGSPGRKAGLLPGDRIVAIDGEATAKRDLSNCMQQLAGVVGEDVTLSILRPGTEKDISLEVTLTRARIITAAHLNADQQVEKYSRDMAPVLQLNQPFQWKGDKIISRVLPYRDVVSLLVRLPIAHAAATGKGSRVAIIAMSPHKQVGPVMQAIAPRAEVATYAHDPNHADIDVLLAQLRKSGCRIAVVPDVHQWPQSQITLLAQRLLSENILPVIPSDLSEQRHTIKLVNSLQAMGALTVGRLSWLSLVLEEIPDGSGHEPFNDCIREIHTDVFAPVGLGAAAVPQCPAATVAGLAALVLEKWPDLKHSEIKEKIISGARNVWQCRSVETGKWQYVYTVDPVTSQYRPHDEAAIFRFRVADAPGALGVDTEIPWPLNMLNCHKAWEITRGRGMVAAISDGGFHINHPALKDKIKAKQYFGQRSFASPNQGFHGTNMSRIFLSVAPEAQIIPILCTSTTTHTLPEAIVRSFEYAIENKVDVISASWSARMNDNAELLAAIRQTVDSGVVVSWFHYPEPYPGLLRTTFTYTQEQHEDVRLGFSDRFLTHPPGFYPAEIEAGLSTTAPQAAGIAVLAKSVNPKLSAGEIETLIYQNSTPIGDGILIPDAYAIVRSAQEQSNG